MTSAETPAAPSATGLKVALGDFEAPHAVLPLQLELGPPLGQGTSGVVSPLLQIIDGGRYVVKEIAPKDGGAKVADSTLHEVKLHRLVSAECCHIVRYVFAQASGPSLCVVMEACDAELWSALIGEDAAWNALSCRDAARKQLTQGELNAMSSELIGAVQHCHKLRVLHRDVNPWNVFLVRRFSEASHDKALPAIACRLGDFGMACQLSPGCETLQGIEADGAVALDESALGSLYSAPELGKSYGFPADVFSLGMTLLAIWAASEGSGSEDAIITVVEAVKENATAVAGGSTDRLVSGGSELLPHLQQSDPRLRSLICEMTCPHPGARPIMANVSERMEAPEVSPTCNAAGAASLQPAVKSLPQQEQPQDKDQKPQGPKLLRCCMRCLQKDKAAPIAPSSPASASAR